jgi:hypothetical protein
VRFIWPADQNTHNPGATIIFQESRLFGRFHAEQTLIYAHDSELIMPKRADPPERSFRGRQTDESRSNGAFHHLFASRHLGYEIQKRREPSYKRGLSEKWHRLTGLSQQQVIF